MDTLKQFLIRRNMYDDFLYNIEIFINRYTELREKYKTALDYYDKIKCLNKPFLHAFGWENTLQGIEYWNELSTEYTNLRNKMRLYERR